MDIRKIQYVPMLKGKENDVVAFSQLPPSRRANIKPLFDLPFFNQDADTNAHIKAFVTRIASKVPADQPCFADFYSLQDYSVAESGHLAIVAGFELFEKQKRFVTPTLSVGREEAVFKAMRGVVRRFGQGVCLRVDVEAIDGQTDQVAADITNQLTFLGVRRVDCDLLLDLRTIGRLQFSAVEVILDFLAVVGQGSAFRSIIVAGSSALSEVTEVPMDGMKHIERTEMKLWDRLVFELAGSIIPIFGDYGIVNPEFFAEGPRPHANAKIRYSNGLRTTYFRGHGLYRPTTDFKQYRSLAAGIVACPYYDGPAFSVGDAYISKVAIAPGPRGFGSLGSWVRADTNRHLAVVATQMQTRANRILAARSVNEALALPA
jgi:hypothetical protein